MKSWETHRCTAGCRDSPGDLLGCEMTAQGLGLCCMRRKERFLSTTWRSFWLLDRNPLPRGRTCLRKQESKTPSPAEGTNSPRPQAPGLCLSGLLPRGSGQTSLDCPRLEWPRRSCPRLSFLGFWSLPGPSAG